MSYSNVGVMAWPDVFGGTRLKGLDLTQRISVGIFLLLLVSLPLAVVLALNPVNYRSRAYLPATSPVTPTPTPTPIFGQAIRLDGNSYIDIPVDSTSDYRFCSSRIFQMWIKTDKQSSEQGQGILSKANNRNTAFVFYLSPENKLHYLHYIGTASAEEIVSKSIIEANRWYQITGVYLSGVDIPPEKQGIYLYVNGEREGFKNSIYSPGQCALGASVKIGSFFNLKFSGLIDEVKLSTNYKLIESFPLIYEELTADTNTIALYHFNGDTNDSSPNEYNGTPIGNVRFVDSDITPPLSPTPTPTPTPTPIPPTPPVIETTSLPTGKRLVAYSASIIGTDINVGETLTMTASGLPTDLSFGNCQQQSVSNRPRITCQITGTPTKVGKFTVLITLKDSAGLQSRKSLTLTINPALKPRPTQTIAPFPTISPF